MDVSCPGCSKTVNVPLVKEPPSLDGYSQKDFKAACRNTRCRTVFDHDLIRVGKFLRDILQVSKGERLCLPGMQMRPSTGLLDDQRPRLFSQLIARTFIAQFDPNMELFPRMNNGRRFPRRTRYTVLNLARAQRFVTPFKQEELINNKIYWRQAPSIKELVQHQSARGSPFKSTASPLRMKFYQATVQATIDAKLFGSWIGGFRQIGDETDRRLGRMWSAYTSNEPASLILSEAVLRQAGFQEKLKEMGWLDRGKFDATLNGGGGAFLLQKSVARYREFFVF